MCNPRRVEVTATRQVRESWEREVRRVAQASADLAGEARIRQTLDDSVGGPALMALQTLLANGFEDWAEQPDGSFRHNVDGGYVLYHPDDRALEIIAAVSQNITETGEASERLSGEIAEQLEARADGSYYDDGYNGRTEQRARQEAQHAAEQALDETIRQRRNSAEQAAEQQRDAALRTQAEEVAQRRIAERGATLQPELNRRARERLEEVGIRARQGFHRLLAHAYRDALTGMARRRGVANQGINTRETDEYLEIEFHLPD